MSIGRRKAAIARVKLIPGEGIIIINGKSLEMYMQYNPILIRKVQSPCITVETEKKYDIIIQCMGGGLSGQANAIKLAISRSLFQLIETSEQKKLRSNGFLTRESLCKERRKYGLKKARKAPQYSKR